MTMNTAVQNADDVAELVFAVVLNSTRNSFDGTRGMIADAPLHDERVLAMQDKFMNATDEEVSDENGCLSRCMTIEANRRIVSDTSCASHAGDQGSHQQGVAHEDAERCHADQRDVPRKRYTKQNCVRISACEQTSVASPRCHTGMPRESGHDEGRQSNHRDSRTQNSSPSSCRVHIKRGIQRGG